MLAYDGELNILDPESGKVLHEVPVAAEWSEPDEWQQPGPMMAVADGTAFVVDPASKKLTMVDVASGKTYRELELTVVPHEIQVTTGTASGEYTVGHTEEGEDHEAHDHDGHDHEGETSDAGGHDGHHDHEGHDH